MVGSTFSSSNVHEIIEHVGMLVINLELAREGLLSYIENIDTSQSHLEYKGYSCH
jgi:hypothetical protein